MVLGRANIKKGAKIISQMILTSALRIIMRGIKLSIVVRKLNLSNDKVILLI